MKIDVCDPPEDIRKALEQFVLDTCQDAIEALPEGVPWLPEYKRVGGEYRAEVDFYYPKVRHRIFFAFRDGNWLTTKDWRD